jgi:hypothetical protein
MERSNHYTAAVERRWGENIRVRVEGFDRENSQLVGGIVFTPTSCGPVIANPIPRPFGQISTQDYSRGVEILAQRRSANRLSGWVSYTLDYARQQLPLTPAAFLGLGPLASGPTDQDQRHTFKIFGMYRLTPSINLSAKEVYGSGLPLVGPTFQPGTFVPIGFNQTRLGGYERLDLRVDKAWAFARWKMTLYAEGLNLTNHENRRIVGTTFDPVTGLPIALSERGLPITPTAGLVFEF